MTNANKKPLPLYSMPVRSKCPICGHTSYSSNGIHPQCAMHAADERCKQRMAGKKLDAKPALAVPGPRYFEKLCPGCKRILHVRRTSCSCGHLFTT